MSNAARIIVIGCAHSAGEAIQGLARAGKGLPAGVEWVSIPCGSGLDELNILRAFEAGAGHVLALACCDGACRRLEGNLWAAKRVAAARKLLEEAGIDGGRLVFKQIAPNMAADLLQWVETMQRERGEE